jgi:hypothetical protein
VVDQAINEPSLPVSVVDDGPTPPVDDTKDEQSQKDYQSEN